MDDEDYNPSEDHGDDDVDDDDMEEDYDDETAFLTAGRGQAADTENGVYFHCCQPGTQDFVTSDSRAFVSIRSQAHVWFGR